MEILTPRKSMSKLIALSDIIMPWAVIFSIIGLILEYTSVNEWGGHLFKNHSYIHGYVGIFNMVFDVFFAFDVIIRTIAYSKSWKQLKLYMGKGLGWVDWLAAIPGFMIPFQVISGSEMGGDIFRQFKVSRIGKFLRIIRLLRILRFFKFLEKMHKDSVFIQKHLMSLILSITLLTIGAIAVLDMGLGVDEDTRYHIAEIIYPNKVNLKNTPIDKMPDDIKKFVHDDPVITKLEKDLLDKHDTAILVILLLLTILLMTIIFYFGPHLAKDIRRVQLVIDSVDADDCFLIHQEMENVVMETGSREISRNEDEILSLIKVIAVLSEKIEAQQSGTNDSSSQEDYDSFSGFTQFDS